MRLRRWREGCLEGALSRFLSPASPTAQSQQGSAPSAPSEPRGSSVGGGEPVAVAAEDADVSSSPGASARVDQVSVDLEPSAGEWSAAGALPDLPETPRSSSRISVDSVGSRPSSSRKSTGAPRDEMISLALERSAMAEAAVVALWAQRARAWRGACSPRGSPPPSEAGRTRPRRRSRGSSSRWPRRRRRLRWPRKLAPLRLLRKSQREAS